MEKRTYYKRKNESRFNDSRYIHHELKCVVCGNTFIARRFSAMYCSDICAKHASINRIAKDKETKAMLKQRAEDNLFAEMLKEEENAKKQQLSLLLHSTFEYIKEKQRKKELAKQRKKVEEERRLAEERAIIKTLLQQASKVLEQIRQQEMPQRFHNYLKRCPDSVIQNITSYIEQNKTIDGLFYEREAPYITSVFNGDEYEKIGQNVKIIWITTEKVLDFAL